MESQEGIKQIPCMEIWDHLCLPKSKSGIGFRKSKMFNNALIAKLTWMVVTKSQFALTIESIWNLRNVAVHNSYQGCVISICKGMELRILEHLQVFQHIPKLDVLYCV